MLPTTTFRWLHLSDFHCGAPSARWIWKSVRHKFHEDLVQQIVDIGAIDFLLFSGDLAYSGQPEQFQELSSELAQLYASLKNAYDAANIAWNRPPFICTAGNHDLARPNDDNAHPVVEAMKSWRPEIESAFWKTDSPYLKVVNDSLAAYHDWTRSEREVNGFSPLRYRANEYEEGPLPGDFSCVIEKESCRLGVVGLNSTFAQLAGGPYQGLLAISSRQLHESCAGDGPAFLSSNDFNILVTHHPQSWLCATSQEVFRQDIQIADSFMQHVYGHEHVGENLRRISQGAVQPDQIMGFSLSGIERDREGRQIERIHGYSFHEVELKQEAFSMRQRPRLQRQDASGTRRFSRPETWNLGEDGWTPPALIARRPNCTEAAEVGTNQENSTLPAKETTDGSPGIAAFPGRNPQESMCTADAVSSASSIPFARILSSLGSAKHWPYLEIIASRVLFNRFPKNSADAVEAVLLQADRRWHLALRGVETLGISHQPHLARQMAKQLESWNNADVARMCVMALGRMGAYEWTFVIEEAASLHDIESTSEGVSYATDKLLSRSIEAFAQQFVRCVDRTDFNPDFDLDHTFRPFAKAFAAAKSFDVEGVNMGLSPTLKSLRSVFKGCAVEHADHLCSLGLTSEINEIVHVACYALGILGLSRTTDSVIRVLDAMDIGAEQSAAANELNRAVVTRALARIGSPAAIDRLWHCCDKGSNVLSDPHAAVALSSILHRLEDEAAGELFASRFASISQGYRYYFARSLGLKRAASFNQYLRGLLSDGDSVTRGCSALALARIDATAYQKDIVLAAKEASTPIEKVLTKLGLLILDPDMEGGLVADELHRELCVDSIAYEMEIQNDIVTVLKEAGTDRCTQLSAVWKRVYCDK